jgi:hypothetical protein
MKGENVIDKIQLTLWDWLVYFLSGFLLIIVVILNLAIYQNNFLENFSIYKDSLFTNLFVLFLLCILSGMLIEPLGNLIEKLQFTLQNLFPKISPYEKVNKREKEIRETYEKLIKLEINTQSREIPDLYHWAKNYLLQNNINTSYMVFLSKFGFYRNVGCIFYLNIFIVIALHPLTVLSVLITICSFLLGLLYFYRSRKFFNDLSLTVYQNFLINKSVK